MGLLFPRCAPQGPRLTLHRKSGLPVGMPVFCRDGVLPVEHLVPGDHVITRNSGFAPILALSRRRILARAIRFAAGALNWSCDVVLPALQPVYIRQDTGPARMVPAVRLLDGSDVTDLGRQRLTVFSLIFSQPEVIFAGGLELAGPALQRDTAERW